MLTKKNSTMLGFVLVGSAIGAIAVSKAQNPSASTSNVPASTQQNSISQRMPKEISEALNAQSALSYAEEKKARLLLKQGDFVGAEAAYNRADSLSVRLNGKTSPSLLPLLGDIYLEQGRYRDALKIYDKMRENKNWSTSSRMLELNTALAYVRLGDLKNAAKFYAEEQFFSSLREDRKVEFLSQLPGTKDAKSFEASLYFARGRDRSGWTDEELENYQKAFKLFPRNGLFAYYLAQSLMRLKRGEEALPMWARAAYFGKGETANDAKKKMNNRYMPAVREKAMRDAAEIK